MYRGGKKTQTDKKKGNSTTGLKNFGRRICAREEGEKHTTPKRTKTRKVQKGVLLP